ncbi:hypothetical protein PGTUg99_011427 [Puccinia graminis f. sp. tritici]|uniref:Uncharacterized protein n=1 Tax=Puccinia graminis f. sp. tritici TaxID=56615 RepID=A0A5B0SHB7_PUCGR|nr:hypothetical protein PGTUg99_011427 [Puccinia graminis f. sp. tritici]
MLTRTVQPEWAFISKRVVRLYSTGPSTDSGGRRGRPTRRETLVDIGRGAAEDQVGPPCARSNLRPIRYSARFSSPPTASPPTGQSAAEQPVESPHRHPYSLEEFRAEPVQLSGRLAELRARLELEDLQWSMFRNRVDKLNQAFWETQSTRFEALEQKQRDAVLAQTVNLPPESVEERLNTRLDQFYASWLIDQKKLFMLYNWRWWGLQAALLKGGWLAQVRDLKWKLACWRDTIVP